MIGINGRGQAALRSLGAMQVWGMAIQGSVLLPHFLLPLLHLGTCQSLPLCPPYLTLFILPPEARGFVLLDIERPHGLEAGRLGPRPRSNHHLQGQELPTDQVHTEGQAVVMPATGVE